ncbi:MAG: NifU family protein [Bacteroidetes bacterium]|jgi:Fe-S cluster biogenesis protein NfuA|nr:NifU family protein [Bacteroidota bacterium]
MNPQSSDITKRINEALDTIRPYLHADGGDVELLELGPDLSVILRLSGACGTCAMSDMTMKAGIEETLRRSIPELGSITAVKD